MQTEASSEPLTAYDGPLPPKMYGRAPPTTAYRPWTPTEYLELRVGDQLSYYHPKVSAWHASCACPVSP